MDLQEEFKLTKERWIALNQKLGELNQEMQAAQIQVRQLEGRYALLEEQIKEQETGNKIPTTTLPK